jgi:hypothetical protein
MAGDVLVEGVVIAAEKGRPAAGRANRTARATDLPV